MNPSSFKTLYGNTLQKEIRNKVFLSLLIFTVFFIMIIYGLVALVSREVESLGLEGSDLVASGLLGFVDIWPVFLGLFLGISALGKDINGGYLGQILSFPIRRECYFCARILGILSMVALYYALGLGFILILHPEAFSEEMGGALSLGFKFLTTLLVALASSGIGSLLSLFLGPMASGFLGLVVLGAIFLVDTTIGFGGGVEGLWENPGVLAILALGIHYLLPRFMAFDSTAQKWASGETEWEYFAPELCHFLGITVLIFAVTIFLFRKKSF